jgi:hypothetical protein
MNVGELVGKMRTDTHIYRARQSRTPTLFLTGEWSVNSILGNYFTKVRIKILLKVIAI